jgi:hypothetical protein
MQDIFSAYVGPGVRARGLDRRTFADQTDTRPTLLALAGLKDDYNVDGRVLVEDLSPRALSPALRAHRGQIIRLGRLYKRILSPTNGFASHTLTASTKALRSGNSAGDHRYQRVEAALTRLDTVRDRLANQIGPALLGAAFHNRRIQPQHARSLIRRARSLLMTARHLAQQ